MKKLFSIAAAWLIFCSILVIPVYAAGSTAISLTPSNSTIRIGDTVTVTGNFNGSTVGTFDMNITYNPAQLKFTGAEGISPAIKAGELDVKDSGSSIQLLYLDGDGGSTGITTGGAFRIRFTVIGGNVGDSVAVGAQITTVGDSEAAAMQASAAPASMRIAAPLSGNTFLSGLSVSDGTLAPAFSKTVYDYNVSVPFSVENLNVTAKTEDATSKAVISSPALAAGGTTVVTVTVTAQSGAKKTYTIKVTREKDPNYKASGNARLKSLTPGQGILSPAFTPDVTAYVVYLPYEIMTFNAKGEMEDAKAQGASSTEIKLEAGENIFTITGKAEDGTEKAYTIKVMRMPSTSESKPLATPTTATSGFRITLSGILTDDQGNPLAGKTVELHSDPQTTITDENGFYQFMNVPDGAHTLYVKEKDGTELAQLPIVIIKGEETSVNGNNIIAKGNTTIDLSLKNGLTLKNVAETKTASTAGNGVPVWIVAVLVATAILAGGAASYFLLGDGRFLFARKMEENNDDEEGPFIVM